MADKDESQHVQVLIEIYCISRHVTNLNSGSVSRPEQFTFSREGNSREFAREVPQSHLKSGNSLFFSRIQYRFGNHPTDSDTVEY
jgi:hypothetical protein